MTGLFVFFWSSLEVVYVKIPLFILANLAFATTVTKKKKSDKNDNFSETFYNVINIMLFRVVK